MKHSLLLLLQLILSSLSFFLGPQTLKADGGIFHLRDLSKQPKILKAHNQPLEQLTLIGEGKLEKWHLELFIDERHLLNPKVEAFFPTIKELTLKDLALSQKVFYYLLSHFSKLEHLTLQGVEIEEGTFALSKRFSWLPLKRIELSSLVLTPLMLTDLINFFIFLERSIYREEETYEPTLVVQKEDLTPEIENIIKELEPHKERYSLKLSIRDDN
jgi:hypothetical protein